ncbi:ATP-grasp domain-containing protein [Pantoea coffeiphila]|uniref:Carbamoyl-phosphate synthase large chain n=1 Tax=Pantoea coffeiphila TaxID=1465635 RepID=A0A2S9I404_9GAMM|nr:ATP-grasp domain-containing protein [Pantoea coffeiphila]PRD12522.1 carbamoyl-phosphate synthase large chain [Pantoea coffeiphila]
MTMNIWLMEGLSSQRDIIQGISAAAEASQQPISVFASHRHQRNEILSQADFALIEPAEDERRLAFIISTVEQHGIRAIHTGRNARWFESRRAEIETSGASLTTGATRVEMLDLADDKVSFAESMAQHGLPVVPSMRIDSTSQLRQLLLDSPFGDAPLCVKPVTGIYGMGFWRFDESASPMAAFTHPDSRRVHPHFYLQALDAADRVEPLVLMPWLPGPEYSIDLLVEKGSVLAAVARRKDGALQHLENSGEAYELGRACAEAMEADGLVNVQTRHDASGKPLLLEINMRPSGGIGYTRFSGVNLPGLFAMRRLGLMTAQQVRDRAIRDFSPATVRSITDVVRYQPLTNLIP